MSDEADIRKIEAQVAAGDKRWQPPDVAVVPYIAALIGLLVGVIVGHYVPL